MTNEQKLLVETVLFNAVRAFHDCDDKEKRKTYTREYTVEFCEEHGIDVMEAIEYMTEMFKEKRKHSQFKYEHYENLEEIILPKKDDGEGR